MIKIRKKVALNYVIGILLLITLLFLIYKQLFQRDNLHNEWEIFVDKWKSGSTFLLLFVLLLAPVNWLIDAFKWSILLRKIENLPFFKIVASVLTGKAFAMVTPGKVGDFAGRILYVQNKNKLRAAIATLVDSLAHTVTTFIFGFIGLVWVNINYPGAWQSTCLIACLAIGILLFTLYWHIDRFSFWTKKYDWLKKIAIAMRILKRYSKKDLIKIWTFSMFRFLIYNTQFNLLVYTLGAEISWTEIYFLSATMFWMIAVIPSFLIADLGVRGFIASLLFLETGIAANSFSVLAGSYGIWLVNVVLPAVIGSLLILTTRILK